MIGKRIYQATMAILGAVSMAAVLGLTACGGPDQQQIDQKCLFDAVSAYPGWDSHAGMLLDHTPSCEQADKGKLRLMVNAMFQAGVKNSLKPSK